MKLKLLIGSIATENGDNGIDSINFWTKVGLTS